MHACRPRTTLVCCDSGLSLLQNGWMSQMTAVMAKMTTLPRLNEVALAGGDAWIGMVKSVPSNDSGNSFGTLPSSSLKSAYLRTSLMPGNALSENDSSRSFTASKRRSSVRSLSYGVSDAGRVSCIDQSLMPPTLGLAIRQAVSTAP